jgi:hypothetical protein
LILKNKKINKNRDLGGIQSGILIIDGKTPPFFQVESKRIRENHGKTPMKFMEKNHRIRINVYNQASVSFCASDFDFTSNFHPPQNPWENAMKLLKDSAR